MRRFTSGFIAGSILGAVGLSYALSDHRTRKRLAKDGRRALERCNEAIESVTSKF